MYSSLSLFLKGLLVPHQYLWIDDLFDSDSWPDDLSGPHELHFLLVVCSQIRFSGVTPLLIVTGGTRKT
jgi:hypothetical protein